MKGSRFNFLFLIVVPSILLMSCTNPAAAPDNAEKYDYSIGDAGPAGGYIFYIDTNDEHAWTYLEVAPESTEWDGAVWCNPAGYAVGEEARGMVIGDGAGNTTAIVESYEANSEVGDGFAAQLCDDLTVEHNGETFADWFMPSQDELNEVFTNLQSTDNPVGGFQEYQYWTSTEMSAYTACDQFFGTDGTQGSHSKLNGWCLRAVRGRGGL